jgi:predicted extracellular nuclease
MRLTRRFAVASTALAVAWSGLAVSVAEALGAAAASPLALPAAGCLETFDGLAAGNSAASLPPGAAFDEAGTSALNNGLYTASDGSSTGGDVYSLGSVGASDRAFGALQSGTLIPTLGVVVRNDTATTITDLAVAYDVEQWRVGTLARADRLNFAFSTTTTALIGGTYTAFAALDGIGPVGSGVVGPRDGNAVANTVAVSATITGLSLAPASTILLRWSDFNATGADDALAVDNLRVAPGGAPIPTALCSTPVVVGGTTLIHDIQGSGAVSPVVGQTKTIEGIVTGLDDLVGSSFGTGNTINTFPTDRGFFVQEEAADVDADPLTGEAIYVGLPSASSALPAIGDKVNLTGTVKDGQIAPTFGQTRIEPSTFTVVSTGNTLPSSVVLDPGLAATQTIGVETNPTRSYYETLEGMRVTLASGVAQSGGTNKFGELFLVPGTATGTLTRNDPVQPALIAAAVDAGAGNPANPKLAPRSTTYIEAEKNDTVTNLTGPLSYSFGNYKVMPQVGALPTVAKTGVAYPFDRLPAATASQRRVASFNLENFFPEDGALDGGIITTAQFAEKRDRAAEAIGRLLGAPDVVAVQEIGDNQHLGQAGATTSLGTLQLLATRLGELGFGSYAAYSLEGNDNRGIDVGFLVKSTVSVVGGPDQRGSLTAAGTCSDVAGRLFDRPPLFLQVDFGPVVGNAWLVSNHFSSKAAPDSCRVAQATWVRDEVKTLESAGNQVIVMGDLNAFQDEGALTTLQDGVTSLANQWSQVPHDEAYSFQFNGVLQTLDHMLLTSGLQAKREGFTYAHVDNDYFDRLTQPDGHKVSDHDPPVLTLGAGGPPVDIPEAPAPVLFGLLGGMTLLIAARRRIGTSVG